MSKTKGRNIKVYADGVVIAAQKTCTITRKYDVIETSSPASGRAKEYILGRYEWEVDVNGLVVAGGFADYILTSGKKVTLRIDEANPDNPATKNCLTGEAYCLQATGSADLGSLAKGALTFKGSGPLDKIVL